MKKKLITIFSLCAAFIISMCNINLKSASAEEEPIMTYTAGTTYYVSMDYYEKILAPNCPEYSSGPHLIFTGINGSMYYGDISGELYGTGFVFSHHPSPGVFCSFMVDASQSTTAVGVRYYAPDSYGTIWEYITTELPEEETGEEITVELGDNLFSSFSYGYSVDSNTGKVHLNGSDSLLLTNLNEIEEEKDLLVSIKFQLGYTVDPDRNISLSNSSFVLFNDNFKNVTSSKEFYYYKKVDYYELDGSGVYYTATILLKNPKELVAGASYFTINPCFWYYTIDGELKYEYASSVTNIYVSFVEKDLIGYSNQLEALDIDYTSSTPTITWSNEAVDITSNYIRLKTSANTQISDVVKYTTATNLSGEELSVSYGSMYTDEIHLEGNQYGYILKATDNDKSEFLVVYLNVVDQTPPVISGSTEYTVPNTSILSIEAVKNSLIVTDNVDSSNEVNLSLKYDYYSSNWNKPGIYYICFFATDTSGNSCDYIVKINVEDRNKPQFYNEYNVVVTNMTVRKSLDSVLVMSDILGQLKAVDAVDGDVAIKTHSDKYSGNGDTEGTYLIVLKAADKSGNVAYFNVNIIVSSEMPEKTIFIGDKLVIVDKTKKLIESDFHTLIKLIGSYNSNTTSYTTISDDIYASSYNVPGEYLVEYNIVTTSGVENDDVLTVRVVESRITGTIKDEAVKEDGIIVSILKWIWNLIVSFFEWIGSLFTK